MSDTWLPLPDDLTPVDPRTINVPSRGTWQQMELPSKLTPLRIPTMEEFDQHLRDSFEPDVIEEFDRQVEELAAASENPDEERAKIYNSLMLSLITGEKPDRIYGTHDALVRFWSGGKQENATSFGKQLADSITSSLMPGRAMPLILRQMFGDDSEELENQIRELESQVSGVPAEQVDFDFNLKEQLVKLLFPFTRPALALRKLYANGFRKAREAIQSGAPGDFFKDSVLEAARIFPMQVQAMLKGGVPGAVLGMGGISAGGLTAALAGGPEAAAPFIAAMGPAGKAGFQLGTVGYIGLIESTQSYRQLMNLEWTDADGSVQKIDKSYAVATSLAVGVVNSLIEYAQIRTIMSGIPGAEKLFQGVARKATAKVLADQSLKRMVLGVLAKGGAKYAGSVASNVAEEMSQEAVTMIFAEITKEINNAVKGTEFEHEWKNIIPQMLAVGKATAKGFALLSVFGNTIQTAANLKTVVEGKVNYDAAIAKLQQSIPDLTAAEARDVLVKHEQMRQEQTKRTQKMLSEGRAVEGESRRKHIPVPEAAEGEPLTQRGESAVVERKAAEAQVAEPTIAFREVTPEEFVKFRDQIAPERKPFITLYTPEELRGPDWEGSRFFVSEQRDGLVGYAISPTGELFNLFNNSGVRGLGQDAIVHATQQGATELFAFDTLEGMYSEHGFETYKREPWNPEYAPEDWDYEKYGTPGVVYMRRPAETVRPRVASQIPQRYRHNPDRPRTMPSPAYAVQLDDETIYFDPDATSPLETAKNLGIPAHRISGSGVVTKAGTYKAYAQQANPFDTPRQRLVSKLKQLQAINPHIKDEQLPYFFKALQAQALARGLTLDQMLKEDLVDEMISTAAIDDAMARSSEEYLQADAHDIFKNLAAQEKNPILPPGRGDQNNEELQTRIRERAITRGLEEIGRALSDGLDLDPALNWYRGAVDDMLRVSTEMVPELANPSKARLFKALLAITSAGTPVRENYNFALDIVRELFRTGKMPIEETTYRSTFTGEQRTVLALIVGGVGTDKIVGGPQLQNVRLNAERLQQLHDELGVDGTVRWLTTKHDGREILDFFGLKHHGTVTKTGQHYGAEVFGPKIGAYFLNLDGNHEMLVTDRWFVRTWNRWMGTIESPSTREVTIQRVRNKTERRLMQESIEEMVHQLTELTGKPWGIDQVQAALWYLEKSIYERAGLTNEEGVSYKEIANERYRRYQQGRDARRDEEARVLHERERAQDLEGGQRVQEEGRGAREEVDDVPYFLYQLSPVYHGTYANFDQFSTDFIGEGEGADSFGLGLYFTNTREIAEYYAEVTARKKGGKGAVYEVSLESINWMEWYDYVDKDTTQYLARTLNVERDKWVKYAPARRREHFDRAVAALRKYADPSFKYSFTGQELYGVLESALGTKERASRFLLSAGIDGIRYPADSLAAIEAGEKPSYDSGTNYVVFDADQVTINNHLLYSSYKAAVQFMKDGRALIYATRHTDLSSLLHEMAHIWRRKIVDPRVRARISEWVGEDLASWDQWSRQSEEKFARGMEQFFAEGRAPVPQLEGVFRSMRHWLKGMVRFVDGVRLPKEVREAYDTMFTPRDPASLGDTAATWELIELERQNRILFDLLSDEDKNAAAGQYSRDTGEDLQAAYEAQRNLWFGNKDERVFIAKVESQRAQARIGEIVRRMGHKKDLKTMARKYDEAMHIYIDTKRDPGAIEEYWEFLNQAQREIVTLSQHLPAELKEMADEMGEVYLATGKEAKDHEVIQNLIKNYVNRAWVLRGEDRGAKFKTTTSHARHRKFRTVIEGWAQGYDLRYKSATVAMREYRQEMIRTIEDKRFIKALSRMRDTEGRPVLSDKRLEGFSQVEHPNFKLYKYAGTTKVALLTRSLREYYEKAKETRSNTEGIPVATPGAVRKLEEVIVNSLMIRGYTEGEAQNALSSVKRAGSKDDVSVIVKEIEKVSREREHVIAESFREVFGKNFILISDGTILERRELFAPEKIAQNLNNILGRSKLADRPVVRVITKFNAIVKSIILTSSMFHHFAFTRSYYLGTNRKAWREMNIFKAHKEGKRAIQNLQPEILLGVRNGLTLGVLQDWDEQLVLEPTFLDKWMDKVGFAQGLRNGVRNAQKWWADRLFDSFGAGLKAKAFLIEYRNQLKKNPGEDPNVLAARVANLINDDFGGLHLGRMGRNPTAQHIFRILFLAPDWTESNFRTLTKAMGFVVQDNLFKPQKLGKADRRLYQAFWAKALIKGMAATVFLNFISAGGDPERFLDNYRRAVEAGNMRVLDIDVTWLWKALGGKGKKRKYFSLIGHFRDPIKWLRYPLKSVRHKLAVAPSTGLEALTKQDWAGRGFTTFGELLKTGETVAWWPEGRAYTDYSWLPSFILNQLVGYTPIQLQNLFAALSGEQDWFESVGNMVGLGIRSTY
jgi:hypothetical protein